MRRDLVPLFGALTLGALYAASFGFLSTDSWSYLAIARSLRVDGVCAIDGAYFATFPCGYPASIALLSWSADEAALIAGSKLVNLLAWAAAAALIHAYARNWPATLVFTLNPVSLLLLFATWSETLMLTAVAGALFAVKRCAARPEARWSNTLLLSGFLLLGCSARYFFGPFLAIFAIGVALCHGRGMLVRIMPGLAAAALCFAGYLGFNVLATGFGTGVPRIPAPEPAAALVGAFLAFVGQQAIDFGGLILILAALSLLIERKWPVGWRAGPEAMLLVALGIGYVLLAFLLRLAVSFDPYGPRTVGPGLVLASAGMAALLLPRAATSSWTLSAVTTIAAFAYSMIVLIGIPGLAAQADHIAQSRDWPIRSLDKALAAYGVKAVPAGTTAIVSFGIEGFPDPLRMAPSMRLYYPAGIRRIGQPGRHDTAADFAARLAAEAPGEGCYFDFSRFRSIEELQRHLQREFAEEVARRLAAIAQPGRLVPCTAFRQLPG